MSNFRDTRRCYVIRTPNLLQRGVRIKGELTFDSIIKIWADNANIAQTKYEEYVAYGKKIGWYK